MSYPMPQLPVKLAPGAHLPGRPGRHHYMLAGPLCNKENIRGSAGGTPRNRNRRRPLCPARELPAADPGTCRIPDPLRYRPKRAPGGGISVVLRHSRTGKPAPGAKSRGFPKTPGCAKLSAWPLFGPLPTPNRRPPASGTWYGRHGLRIKSGVRGNACAGPRTLSGWSAADVPRAVHVPGSRCEHGGYRSHSVPPPAQD